MSTNYVTAFCYQLCRPNMGLQISAHYRQVVAIQRWSLAQVWLNTLSTKLIGGTKVSFLSLMNDPQSLKYNFGILRCFEVFKTRENLWSCVRPTFVQMLTIKGFVSFQGHSPLQRKAALAACVYSLKNKLILCSKMSVLWFSKK